MRKENVLVFICYMSRCYQKKESGFSIIELLVVIFIIGLISSSVLVSYFNGNNQYSLTQATQILAANIRQVQNKALSGQQQGVSPYGFGVKIVSATQYVIFLNPTSAPSNDYVEGSSQIVETISLPTGTVVSPINQRIFYIPPDPTTYLNNSAGAGSITLTITAGPLTKNVVAYSNGKIEIN